LFYRITNARQNNRNQNYRIATSAAWWLLHTKRMAIIEWIMPLARRGARIWGAASFLRSDSRAAYIQKTPQILAGRRRSVIQATLILRNTMLCNIMLSYSVRWLQ